MYGPISRWTLFAARHPVLCDGLVGLLALATLVILLWAVGLAGETALGPAWGFPAHFGGRVGGGLAALATVAAATVAAVMVGAGAIDLGQCLRRGGDDR